MTVRILLADDHQIVRDGLKALLEREGFKILGESGDGHDTIRLAREQKPDVVILDYGMPLLNGIDAAREILKDSPRTKTILLTMHKEDGYVLRAIQAGMSGYVVKSQAAQDLVQAIRDVLEGGIYLSPGISRTVIQAFLSKKELPGDPLSPRERQVLQLIAEGNSTKQIAHLLGLSVKTVETHRSKIMEKLDIHEVASLVRYAIRKKIIEA